jgi:putative two-component system response regulator
MELLIVDDDDALRRWAERVMRSEGYSCAVAPNASAARELLHEDAYQLVLLDVNMPGESGIELLSHIRSSHPTTAVLMVTGQDDAGLARAAIELGVYGYMVKPVGSGELVINVANALHRRRRELESNRLVSGLRENIEERNEKLEQTLEDLRQTESQVWASQAETILQLARLVEFRDEETGRHLQRMSSYCEFLARRFGFSAHRCELIRLASQLHDVGKVTVPDHILRKRGTLTDEEFEVIKGHAEVGYRMLAHSASEVVRIGAQIALTHHERWDGTGYPNGLMGEGIPLEGRIAAIADVFDALTSDRVYRSAFPPATAQRMMREQRESHFDPELLDAFFAVMPDIEAIRLTYAD